MNAGRVLTMVTMALIRACASPGNPRKVKGTLIQPILRSWVVPVPSDGKIISFSGQSSKLDRSKGKFIELCIGSAIVFEDLLLLKKDSRVTIKFTDDSEATIDPRDYPIEGFGDDVYFTIEKKEIGPSNQAL